MRGAIHWFAEHGVAANMLMVLILAGGIVLLPGVEQEVFPEVDSGIITVSVEMRGASTDEVEEGVCIKVEEAVAGIEGLKKVESRAVAGMGTVTLELESDADVREVLDDVKSKVDAIDTFPDQSESPIVTEFEVTRQVLNIAISGALGEAALRRQAELVRDEVLTLPGISRVELAGVRPYEVSIEVSESALRAWQLGFDEVVAAVRRSSLDLSGGSIKTRGGEILLRTKAQAYRQADFEEIVLRTRADGSRVYLSDVAKVVDGFEDTGQKARFDGAPGALVQVYRVGDQRALDVAATIKDYVEEAAPRMPDGVSLTVWQDESRVLRSRMDLLLENGRQGLLLVFITLALFLRLSLAFWVTLGIPISFLGAVLLMPGLDVSINMISLFAFIVALGIVVDDAIVVGENIYARAEEGLDGMAAVKKGVDQVSTPVIFAILTTIAAFSPLVGIPGVMGKFVAQLPLIVVPTLLFSLVESLFILPAHLVHVRIRERTQPGLLWLWEKLQNLLTSLLQRFIERVYTPVLRLVLGWRYLAFAAGVTALLLTGAAFAAGKLRFTFFPDVEADNVVAFVAMPQGTPPEVTERAVRRMEAAALALGEEIEAREGGAEIFRHVLATVGEQPFRSDQSRGFGDTSNFSGRHLGEVNIELVPAEDRDVESGELVQRWREAVGEVADAEELVFTSNLLSTGEAIDIQLTGDDVGELRAVAEELKLALRQYPGVFDIRDSFKVAQRELRLDITPEAESLGLTKADLARQVRQGFYGEEAQRIQRGRDEVRVMVRYPEEQRAALGDVEDMRVRLADGSEVPFGVVARVDETRGDAVIQRSDRRRSIHVTADVDLTVNEPNAVLGDVTARVLPGLLADHPGVRYSLEGERREQDDTVGGMIRGFLLALILIYALLAIPFRSYVQPIVVMLAIPFGIAGAIWGHALLGMDVTVMSMFGIVALTGVLVNDSLVLIEFANRVRREDGVSAVEAVALAGPARFRAILLTSLTTFAGLTPLLLERSMQARFLIPMAVSLGFGVLFATVITLLLVPTAYLMVEDLRRMSRWRPGRAPTEARAAA